jgi:hypothetical protein
VIFMTLSSAFRSRNTSDAQCQSDGESGTTGDFDFKLLIRGAQLVTLEPSRVDAISGQGARGLGPRPGSAPFRGIGRAWLGWPSVARCHRSGKEADPGHRGRDFRRSDRRKGSIFLHTPAGYGQLEGEARSCTKRAIDVDSTVHGLDEMFDDR